MINTDGKPATGELPGQARQPGSLGQAVVPIWVQVQKRQQIPLNA